MNLKPAITFIAMLNSVAYGLEENFCIADEGSKKYLSDHFSKPYPKKVKFSCIYKCQKADGHQTIKGISEMTVNNLQEDATRVVCQGVKVKKVSYGYEFDKTLPFYAHEAQTPQVKAWANLNINHNNSYEYSKLLSSKSELNLVARNYIQAAKPGYEYFKKAGIVLMDIAYGLPEDTSKLDKYLHEISLGQISNDMLTADSLIKTYLNSIFKYRIP